MSVTTIPGHKSRLSFIKKHPKWAILAALLVVLGAAGGWVYSVQARKAVAAAAESAPQTATVRQGNLVISASGTGVLAVANQIDLAFTASGQVIGVYVEPGDQVEAGTLLAQQDDQEAQINYTKAKQAYLELTSAAAIASAQGQVAQAQSDLMSARYQLEYLISPKVLYWETEIVNGEKALTEAKARAEASPSDENAQQALKKARDTLSFAKDSLKGAWQTYNDEYVPETFRLIEDGNEVDVYAVPTEQEIQLARAAIDEAQKKVNDSQEYYNVLTGEAMPEDASSDALVKLQQAKRDLEDAQIALDGTKIVAPVAGTILSVEASAGGTVDTSTAISMADLSQLELDFYLDASDWGLAAVGNQVQVTFDALPDKSFSGQVTQLDSELYQSNNTSSVKGIAQFDRVPDVLDLPIGASASVEVIHAQADDVLLVPIEALHEIAPGKYAVFVVENGALSQRAVEIGLQDQVYAEVKSGLIVGDVVSTGLVSAD